MLMVRETVPSQQLQYHATSKWIKTTASGPLEKFASECLNQNGDLSQGLGLIIRILADARLVLLVAILPIYQHLLMVPSIWRDNCTR